MRKTSCPASCVNLKKESVFKSQYILSVMEISASDSGPDFCTKVIGCSSRLFVVLQVFKCT